MNLHVSHDKYSKSCFSLFCFHCGELLCHVMYASLENLENPCESIKSSNGPSLRIFKFLSFCTPPGNIYRWLLFYWTYNMLFPYRNLMCVHKLKTKVVFFNQIKVLENKIKQFLSFGLSLLKFKKVTSYTLQRAASLTTLILPTNWWETFTLMAWYPNCITCICEKIIWWEENLMPIFI